MAELVGQKIGNYRIVRLIGEGGMGRVFEAVHEQIERRAAIKVLHAQFAHNSEAYNRFLNEARAVNIVHHPGVVSIFEFGQTEDGSPYIVMEYLEGEGLDKRLERQGRMSLATVRIARQIASTLVAAHAKHVVHRDLKPSNVMLVPDSEMPGGERAKVVDFGIAKVSSEHSASGYKTRAGAILGTPTYMSPEQCRGAGEVTEKSDVYSLGVMIYEMLVGRPPFVADGEGEVMGMHLFKSPPPLHSIEPTLPLDLVDLVHSMLVKDQDRRPAMIDVARELDRIGQRLSGQRAIGMQEMAAAAAEPRPPGPKTMPLDAEGHVIAGANQDAVPNSVMDGAIIKSGPLTPTIGVAQAADPAPKEVKQPADSSTPAPTPAPTGVAMTAQIDAPKAAASRGSGRALRIGIPIAVLTVILVAVVIWLARRNTSHGPLPQTPPVVQQVSSPPADLGASMPRDLSMPPLDLAAATPPSPPAPAAKLDGGVHEVAAPAQRPTKMLKKKKKVVKGLRNEEIEYVE